MDKLAYGIKDAAKLISLGYNTVYEKVQRGEIKVVFEGKKMVIPRWELERYLREHEVSVLELRTGGKAS